MVPECGKMEDGSSCQSSSGTAGFGSLSGITRSPTTVGSSATLGASTLNAHDVRVDEILNRWSILFGQLWEICNLPSSIVQRVFLMSTEPCSTAAVGRLQNEDGSATARETM